MSNAKKIVRVIEQGFSLIEALLIVVVIASAVFLISNIPNALMLITRSKHVSLAREIAVKQIEDKRSMSYANISLGSSSVNDTRLNSLPQGSGTLVVGVKDESTPDPDDWINCDRSSVYCQNGEAVKPVTVTINWDDNNKQQTLTLTTLIGEGGINQ